MSADLDQGPGTRLLFLGDERLADGFRLIGFETFPNPDPDMVDKVLRELLRDREKAFVIVDDRIMRSDIKGLTTVRREGGRVVVVSVPRLDERAQLSSEVSDRLAAMFGNGIR